MMSSQVRERRGPITELCWVRRWPRGIFELSPTTSVPQCYLVASARPDGRHDIHDVRWKLRGLDQEVTRYEVTLAA